MKPSRRSRAFRNPLARIVVVLGIAVGVMVAANLLGLRGDARYFLLFALFVGMPLAIGIILQLSDAGRNR